MALLLALEFTRDLGLSRILFEGDSLHVIHKLNNTQADWSEIQALVTEGRLRLITFFLLRLQFTIIFTALGFRWTSDRFWVEEVLFQVESAMAADKGSNAHLP
ncbi:hypothetical protein Gohar_001193 [Gossypium harknessii]|uniref:RNase H type-1 domain-containing protein n=1 Tax=Gossypium harknessii TaxID=34285 RepID=A0A7J9I341_9ROSI|nr:hypothetical protein [Gossypium harknessii]